MRTRLLPPAGRSSRGLLAAAAALLAALVAGGCMGGVKSGRRAPIVDEAPPVSRGPSRAPSYPANSAPVVVNDREVGRLTPEDFEEFNRAWVLFVKKDRAWPIARDAWLAHGGAAPYVLSENLLRYFMSATVYGKREDLNRIAVSAQKAGEPAVGYFAGLLRLDTIPLQKPIVRQDSAGKEKTLTEWHNDDVTRQQLAYVIAAIGPPAVPLLTTPAYLHADSPSARRYVMYALGRIGSDAAVDAVAQALSSPDWQERGSAAKALGLAIAFTKSERARSHLQRVKSDPDPFVRRKAEEALAGKTKGEF